MIGICPECKQIANYSLFFKAWICMSPNCKWMFEESYNAALLRNLERKSFEKGDLNNDNGC